MSSGCVFPLDIHAMVRDSSTPIGKATTARRNAARISYSGSPCSDMTLLFKAAQPQHDVL